LALALAHAFLQGQYFKKNFVPAEAGMAEKPQ
jgi:hypothetical protein